MSDLDIILDKTERSMGRRQIQAGHALMVVMVREIGWPIGDVWSALTVPERYRNAGCCQGVLDAR